MRCGCGATLRADRPGEPSHYECGGCGRVRVEADHLDLEILTKSVSLLHAPIVREIVGASASARGYLTESSELLAPDPTELVFDWWASLPHEEHCRIIQSLLTEITLTRIGDANWECYEITWHHRRGIPTIGTMYLPGEMY